MKIFVKAKPGARKAGVEKIDEMHFVVAVRERAHDNEANFAIIEALGEYFSCSIAHLRLVSGRTASQKIFEVETSRYLNSLLN